MLHKEIMKMSLLRNATGLMVDRAGKIRYYFRNAKCEVAERNLFSLKIASVGGVFLTLFIYAVSRLVYGAWKMTWHGWLLIIVLAAFSLFALLYGKRRTIDFNTVQAVCIFFISITIILLVNISVFPFPHEPESLIGCYLILVPLFFIIRPLIITLLVITGGAIFCILAYMFKTPLSASHDIFTTILGMIFSLIVLAYTCRLRSNDYFSREKYRKLSHTDLLTGLLNKRSYEFLCQQQLKERDVDSPCALFVFDIDNFKRINDTYGHIMGDRVLELVGKNLSAYFREGDLVGRIGGDEFSAFVCIRGSCDAISLRAEQILAEIQECACRELNVEVTMSLGIAIIQRGAVKFHELYANADKALYSLKRSPGKGWQINIIK